MKKKRYIWNVVQIKSMNKTIDLNHNKCKWNKLINLKTETN